MLTTSTYTLIFHSNSEFDNIPNLMQSCKQHISFGYSELFQMEHFLIKTWDMLFTGFRSIHVIAHVVCLNYTTNFSFSTLVFGSGRQLFSCLLIFF